MASLPEVVQMTVTLNIDLDSPVRVWDLPPPGVDEDWAGEGEAPEQRTVALGELVAERLLDRAGGPLLEAALRVRFAAITDEEIRDHVRARIAALMATTNPATLTDGQLTLAARIDREYARQLTDPHSGGFAHGRDAPTVAAIVQAEVTAGFRDLSSDVVAQVRERVLAEIAAHARSAEDPIPPGG